MTTIGGGAADIANNQHALDYTLAKIERPNYNQIRNILKSYSNRFNHLHSDDDLKRMSTVQALEIVHWFNEEALGVPRGKLLDNFSVEFFSQEGLPVEKNLDQCVQLLNANMLTYKGLAKINQYLPFHFNMILNPEDYPAEWKLVLQ